MTEKHTKGPWRAEGPDDFGDYNILEPSCALAVAAVISNLRMPREIKANAQLVAAAPELLEALKLFDQRVRQHGNFDDGCFYYGATSASELQEPLEKARAAIAKAMGAA